MCQNGTEKARLLEATGVPEFYADGACKIEIHGPNARITYFAHRTVDGEAIMMPVAEIVLPVTSIGTGAITDMIRRAKLTGRAVIGEVGETAH